MILIFRVGSSLGNLLSLGVKRKWLNGLLPVHAASEVPMYSICPLPKDTSLETGHPPQSLTLFRGNSLSILATVTPSLPVKQTLSLRQWYDRDYILLRVTLLLLLSLLIAIASVDTELSTINVHSIVIAGLFYFTWLYACKQHLSTMAQFLLQGALS